jgi:hypothetical protein
MEFRSQPDLFERGDVSARIRRPAAANGQGRSTAQSDQLTGAGSQGGPLFQGCVANAPTAGAGVQSRPSV